MRDYKAEYARRKAREQAAVDAERDRRYERARAVGRAKHSRYTVAREDAYYLTAAQKKYWEVTYPRKIRALSADEREELAERRGISEVFPGFEGSDEFPEAIRDAMIEDYLLGWSTRGRDNASLQAKERAVDLFTIFTGAKPNWRAFREWYSRHYN